MPPDDLNALRAALRPHRLAVAGAFAPDAADGLDRSVQSVVLLSPAPGFWEVFAASDEYADTAPDPMDRWSLRVVTRLAQTFEAKAYFPFARDGQPPSPFFSWAPRGGGAWPSPLPLLVGAETGLNLSFRGALGLTRAVALPKRQTPCTRCEAPCTTACPVDALGSGRYDVETCKSYLRATPDCECRRGGCLARRACPVSFRQPEAHARFHMEAFLA